MNALVWDVLLVAMVWSMLYTGIVLGILIIGGPVLWLLRRDSKRVSPFPQRTAAPPEGA